MFERVLTSEQVALAEKLFPGMKDFYLAGGTALALQLGHRRSIDFDLASYNQINPHDLERKLIKNNLEIQTVFTATGDELSVIINNTKVTFFYFPFNVPHTIKWKRGRIELPGIIELGAMKAYALGRRNMWKDYVDLYFILKFRLDIGNLIEKSNEIFGNHFNSKLFREQLCYFDDLDRSESIEYLDFAPEDSEIKEFLEDIAIKI
ncbi:nucleotidyl transferase AbiEii/AbiGii toxin family protein [Thermodesulfobacteriota bacterium]